MVAETKNAAMHDQQQPPRGKRIKGICADSQILGVSRIHLWHVLHGHRESAPLLERYQILKAVQKKQAA
jgi:hypothetical protein